MHACVHACMHVLHCIACMLTNWASRASTSSSAKPLDDFFSVVSQTFARSSAACGVWGGSTKPTRAKRGKEGQRGAWFRLGRASTQVLTAERVVGVGRQLTTVSQLLSRASLNKASFSKATVSSCWYCRWMPMMQSANGAGCCCKV